MFWVSCIQRVYFFVSAKKQTSVEPSSVTTTTIPQPVCDDETFKPYTLYTSSGEGNTVMSCRNESDALASGYIYYANPKPPPQAQKVRQQVLLS